MAFWTHWSLHERLLLIAFMVLKWLLIVNVPLTGDEAYFIVWGHSLSLGYYDHPPMVGWVLGLMSQVADDLLWYRSFAFFASAVIAWLLFLSLRLHPSISTDIAYYVALAFFVSPVSLMFVVTANDTVLVFFSVVAFYFYAKALAQPSWWHAVLAGIFLGLAFLSKYFAAFMLVGLFIYSLVYWRRYGVKWLAVMTAIIMVFVLENLYFNATHCWNNILFNFFSRTTESAFQIGNVVTYVLMVLTLLSPLGVFYLWQQKGWSTGYQTVPQLQQALFASVVLLLVLLVVSFTNPVGLHWPLIGVTLLYLFYAMLNGSQLRKLYLFNVYSSLFIGIALLAALPYVIDLISPTQKHHVSVYTQPEKVCAQLPKQRFFTLGYSSQSTLSYHCGNDQIHVFMSTSKYGREDDKKTDFKTLDGQALTIFVPHEKDIAELKPFFVSVDVKLLPIDEHVTYYLVTGHGFDYARYREQILTQVNELYYTPPTWFPDVAGWLGQPACGFKKKYGFSE